MKMISPDLFYKRMPPELRQLATVYVVDFADCEALREQFIDQYEIRISLRPSHPSIPVDSMKIDYDARQGNMDVENISIFDHNHKGFGDTLVRITEEVAKEIGVLKVQATICTNHSWWEKRGYKFVDEDVRRKYISSD